MCGRTHSCDQVRQEFIEYSSRLGHAQSDICQTCHPRQKHVTADFGLPVITQGDSYASIQGASTGGGQDALVDRVKALVAASAPAPKAKANAAGKRKSTMTSTGVLPASYRSRG